MAKQKATMDIAKDMPALHFDFQLKSGSGNILGEMRQILADTLEGCRIPKVDTEKQKLWSTLLWDNKPLELDSVDFKKLKEFCTSDESPAGWMPLVLWKFREYFENLND